MPHSLTMARMTKLGRNGRSFSVDNKTPRTCRAGWRCTCFWLSIGDAARTFKSSPRCAAYYLATEVAVG